MNKQEFLDLLKQKLEGLPTSEVKKAIDFYSEVVDDRIEEGMNEYEAVEDMEDIDDIVRKVTYDIPFPTIMKEKLKRRKSKGLMNTLLLFIGFPVWGPLMLAGVIVAGALLFALIAVIVSLVVAIVGTVIGGILTLILAPFKIVFGIGAMLFNMGTGLIIVGLAFIFFKPVREMFYSLWEVCKWGIVKLKTYILKSGESE